LSVHTTIELFFSVPAISKIILQLESVCPIVKLFQLDELICKRIMIVLVKYYLVRMYTLMIG
jgi:hypothetical protein